MADDQAKLKLEQQVASLKSRLEKAASEWKKAQRSRHDEVMLAVLTGLAVNWDGSSAEELIRKAERAAEAAMRFRKLRTAGESPLDPKVRARDYRKAHPLPAVGAAPSDRKLAQEFRDGGKEATS